MAAPTSRRQKTKTPLANGEPSTHGQIAPKRSIGILREKRGPADRGARQAGQGGEAQVVRVLSPSVGRCHDHYVRRTDRKAEGTACVPEAGTVTRERLAAGGSRARRSSSIGGKHHAR